MNRLGAAAVRIERTDFHTWPVFVARPREGEPRGRMLYLHGGGHVTELSPTHWQFIARLVLATGWSAVVPAYPLAPHAGYRDIYPTLEQLYADRIASGGNTAIAGDSSGGTLSLALLQSLPHDDRPSHTLLFSPWLDAVLDNPEIPALEPLDPWGSRDGLRRIAQLFAHGDDLAEPGVSPLRGSLDQLGQVTVFAGTRDILTPDAHLLARTAGPGTKVDVREYERTHNWMFGDPADAAAIAREVAVILGATPLRRA
jgi:acetyl esterase/lipase